MYFFVRARIELNKVVNTCALSVPFHTVFVTHMNLSFFMYSLQICTLIIMNACTLV